MDDVYAQVLIDWLRVNLRQLHRMLELGIFKIAAANGKIVGLLAPLDEQRSHLNNPKTFVETGRCFTLAMQKLPGLQSSSRRRL